MYMYHVSPSYATQLGRAKKWVGKPTNYIFPK